MPDYYDNWRTAEYDCSHCQWHGIGTDLRQGDLLDDGSVFLCPFCEKSITFVYHPTLEGSRTNWEKVSDADRKAVEGIENLISDYDRRKLRDASQLPDIASEGFVLDWDCVKGDGFRSETLIKHGSTIIFQEPSYYECYER